MKQMNKTNYFYVNLILKREKLHRVQYFIILYYIYCYIYVLTFLFETRRNWCAYIPYFWICNKGVEMLAFIMFLTHIHIVSLLCKQERGQGFVR